MKKILIWCCTLLLCNSTFAQTTMGEVLKAMPDSLIPYLTHNNRLDCLDFKDAGMKAEVKNAFDGKTELVKLTDDMALFQLNAAVQMDIRLLHHVDEGQVLCIITTWGADMQESSIQFFTTQWQQLETERYIAIPEDMGPYTAQWESGATDVLLTLKHAIFIERPAIEGQEDPNIWQINLKWNGNLFNKS